ncbi:MAG: hypothetical protein OEV00_11415 [Acidobacteriota bacterium]|nr:hypothetical protein [Acidobacteriota bacterium]MDH3785922.1 hypothetical protein [Acidobacteriota bacterium]
MSNAALFDRFRRPRRPLGDQRRTLRYALGDIHLDGLDEDATRRIEARWGPFLVTDDDEFRASSTVVRVTVVEGPGWLPVASPGEIYRLERVEHRGSALVVSYHYAVRFPDAEEEGDIEVAVVRTEREPIEQMLDNIARLVVARHTMDRGGLAIHGAGIVRDDQAFVFAGPSRAGKSTVTTLSRPSRSLGDDFAVILPSGDGATWWTCALPFDNHPIVETPVAPGLLPLRGVWRLFQAGAGESTRVETPNPIVATTSLMACAAFPAAISDRGESLLGAAGRYIAEGRFEHLTFTPDPEFWTLIER